MSRPNYSRPPVNSRGGGYGQPSYNNNNNNRGAPPPPLPPRIDRDRSTPALLRTFVKHAVHHDDQEFSLTSVPHQDEHQLYIWRDTSMRELLLLLRDAVPSLRVHALARFSVRLVYFDSERDKFVSRDIANLSAKDLLRSGGGGPADKTLQQARFVSGDFVDVAYLAPAGGPPGVGGPGGGPGGRDFAPHFGANGAPSAATAAWGPAPTAPHLTARGGGNHPRGGFGGGGRGNGRGDAWAPSGPRGDGPANWGARGGGGVGRGGGGFDRGGRGRYESGGRDAAMPPPRRRDSRSRSPVRRDRSPPPPPRE